MNLAIGEPAIVCLLYGIDYHYLLCSTNAWYEYGVRELFELFTYYPTHRKKCCGVYTLHQRSAPVDP